LGSQNLDTVRGWHPAGVEVAGQLQDSSTVQGMLAVKGGLVLWCGRGCSGWEGWGGWLGGGDGGEVQETGLGEARGYQGRLAWPRAWAGWDGGWPVRIVFSGSMPKTGVLHVKGVKTGCQM